MAMADGTTTPATATRPRVMTPVEAMLRILDRNTIAYRGAWPLFVTGFLEPVLYLFSIGIGVGKLVESFEFHGQPVPYAAFVAPAMLAASAMNGALLDSTFNMFFKLKYDKVYDQMLATPLTTSDVARGEVAWCLVRGGTYSAAFLLVMLVALIVIAVVVGRSGRRQPPPGPSGESMPSGPHEAVDYHAARSDALRFQNPNQV